MSDRILPKVFSAVPPAPSDPISLQLSVQALKANIDLLTGQSAGGAFMAVTASDLKSALAGLGATQQASKTTTTPGTLTPVGQLFADLVARLTHNDSNLTAAVNEIQNIIPVQIDNAIAAAQAEVKILFADGLSKQKTTDVSIQASITSLTATTNANTAAISNETIARTSADSALSTSITNLTTTTNANTAAISSETSARTTADSGLSTSITNLTTTVNNNLATLNTEITTRANADSALSGTLTTVSAKANQASANGSYGLIATSSGMTGVAAEFMAQVSANGGSTFAQAGMRLQALNDGTGRVVFDVNEFVIRDPANNSLIPFATIGGQVYIQHAAIQDGTIGQAKITDGSITNAKIANAAIGTAQIQNAAINGTLIANNVIVTGHLQANVVTTTWTAGGGYTATGNFTQLLNVFFTPTDTGTILVMCECNCNIGLNMGAGGGGGGGSFIYVYVDGTLYAQRPLGFYVTGCNNNVPSGTYSCYFSCVGTHNVSFVAQVTPGASHSVSIYTSVGSYHNGAFDNGWIQVTEIKR